MIFNVKREKKYSLRSSEMVYLNQNVASLSYDVKILTNKRLPNKHSEFPFHISLMKLGDYFMAGLPRDFKTDLKLFFFLAQNL